MRRAQLSRCMTGVLLAAPQVSCSRAGHTLWVHTGRRGQGQAGIWLDPVKCLPQEAFFAIPGSDSCASWDYASALWAILQKTCLSGSSFPRAVPTAWLSFVSVLTPKTVVPLMVPLSPKPSMAPQYPQFKVQSLSSPDLKTPFPVWPCPLSPVPSSQISHVSC